MMERRLVRRRLAAVPTMILDDIRCAGGSRDWSAVVVDGTVRLAGPPADRGGRITLVPTPGHTVGHRSALVEGARDQIVVTGDVLVHAVQLVNPGVARETRRTLLATAAQRGALLATAHLTRPFVPAGACG